MNRNIKGGFLTYSGDAKSGNCMGNATWKNDCKYFRKWSIDSYSFIPCSFYLWIVYSPNGEKRLSNSSFPCRD